MTGDDLHAALAAQLDERSCTRHPEVRDVVPDPFRLAHREEIHAVVREVVSGPEVRVEPAVEARAERLFDDVQARTRFIAIVLGDLDALHEGNFMRYRISPEQFQTWCARRSV